MSVRELLGTTPEPEDLVDLLDRAELPSELRVLVSLGELVPDRLLPDGTLRFALPHHRTRACEHFLHWHPDLAATWVQGTRFYVAWKRNFLLPTPWVQDFDQTANVMDLEGLALCSSELTDLLDWLAENRV